MLTCFDTKGTTLNATKNVIVNVSFLRLALQTGRLHVFVSDLSGCNRRLSYNGCPTAKFRQALDYCT